MNLRLQTFLAGFFAFLTAALLALAPAQAKPTSGGYQLFEPVASGISADIQLASLGNFAPSPETASEYANATNNIANPPSLTISNSQWGTKSAQHMRDFGMDVSNPAQRQQFRDMVENIGSNPDRVVTGTFSGGGPTGRRDVLFYVQGNDVVVTSPAGEFVTVLQNGVTNPNVVRAIGQ